MKIAYVARVLNHDRGSHEWIGNAMGYLEKCGDVEREMFLQTGQVFDTPAGNEFVLRLKQTGAWGPLWEMMK